MNEARVPELRYPEFEGTWEKSELGRHAEITTGRLDANAMVENGRYPFFTCAKQVYEIDIAAFDTEALLVSGNGANVGYVHYYNGKFNAYQRTYVLDQFDQEILFIEQLLRSRLRKRIFKEAKEGNTPYIVKGTLSEMPIVLPSLPEQKKIAAFLSAVDDKLAAVEAQLAGWRDYKRGMMQALFSQTLRFKADDGSEFPKWERKRIKNFAKINPSTKTIPDTFNYIDLEAVKAGRLAETKVYSNLDAPSRAQRVLTKGDILFQTVRPYQMNNLSFDRDGEYVASTGYTVIQSNFSQKYLYHFLHTRDFVNEVMKLSLIHI